MLTETARRRWLFLGSCVLALVAVSAVEPQQGRAAQLIGRDVHGLRLEADRGGEALLLFTAQGKPNHVLVWGALNARPPSGHVPQVQFRVDYSGGWKKYRHVGLGKPYWQTFSNACRPYTGPTLLYQIAACDAPDGSYWAVQQWPQPLPDLGYTPWLPAQRQQWAEVSHWSGPLAVLTVYTDWVYGHYHHLFGNYTYQGKPIYGFHTTPTGVPTDDFGRLIYLDTYDSAYGAGWRRENSYVTHGPSGAWCYGFFPHDPTTGGYQHPRGQTASRGPGNGTRYRLLAEGPGVTPDVQAVATDPGDWNPADPAKVAFLDAEMTLLPTVVGTDAKCLKGHDIQSPQHTP
jgi:hypothetical protein